MFKNSRSKAVMKVAGIILGLVLVWLGLYLDTPKISHITGTQVGQPPSPITLPWRFETAANGNLVSFDLEVDALSPRVFRIFPDDLLTQIKVNGLAVSLDGVSEKARRDFGDGVMLDLTAYLTNGTNLVEISFDNGGGPGGLDLRAVNSSYALIPIYFGMLFMLASLIHFFGLNFRHLLLLSFVLVTIFVYWQKTNWLNRCHDVGGESGHMGYIKYINEHGSLPKPSAGWVYYHPPLYYLMGAGVLKTAKAIHASPEESLQVFSIFLWNIFLLASMGALNTLFRNRAASFWSASIVIAYWPSGIIRSVALGNDIAFYAFAGLATFLLFKWWKTGKRRDLVFLAIFCILALLTKSNGLVLCAAAGLLIFIRFIFSQRSRKLKHFIDGFIFAGLAFSGVLISFAARIYYYYKGEVGSWFISNAGGLGSGLLVPKTIKAFIPLDLPTFLTEPYINPVEDRLGRGNFWNYLLRSSITGEHSFSDRSLDFIPYTWGCILITLIAVAFLALNRDKQNFLSYRFLPLTVLSILWVGSLIYLRITLPFGCSNDFRYILPVLIPMAAFWATSGKLNKILMWLIAPLTFIFYWYI